MDTARNVDTRERHNPFSTEALYGKSNHIHVYFGSSFNPDEKWVTRGYDETYFSPNREEAIRKAIIIYNALLIKPWIVVHSFGKMYPHKYIIKRVK